jgi:hypothetical protein
MTSGQEVIVTSPIVEKIVAQTESLPYELQQRVLEYVLTLTCADPAGVSGDHLLRFAGIIPSDDLKRIRDAIQQGCAHVDTNEW